MAFRVNTDNAALGLPMKNVDIALLKNNSGVPVSQIFFRGSGALHLKNPSLCDASGKAPSNQTRIANVIGFIIEAESCTDQAFGFDHILNPRSN